MTRAPRNVVPEFETLADVAEILRKRGMRLSSARRNLLIGLFSADGLVTADEIASGLGGTIPSSDVPVVYRNLETFEAMGIVRHVHLDHGPGRYVIAAGGAKEYMVCERCGKVLVVTPAELDPVREQVIARFGFEASFEHFPIVGVCSECAPALETSTLAQEVSTSLYRDSVARRNLSE